MEDVVSDKVSERSHDYEVIKVIPFDPVKRSNEVIVAIKGKNIHIMRGACESVIERCGLTSEHDECAWAREQGASVEG